MHYLQGQFDTALGSLISELVPSHKYMSVHDFFNPQLFHACLLRIITDIPELAPHAQTLSLPTLLRQDVVQGYIEQRVANFTTVCQVMAEASQALGLLGWRPTKEALFAMVRHCDLDELQGLLERLFQLVIRSHRLLEFITTLPENNQFAIRDFIQRAKDRQDVHTQQQLARHDRDHQRERLEEENTQLRQLLSSRESELEQAQHQVRELEDQVGELKELQLAKEAHIDGLKRRLIAYEETDSLFQEKDQEIFKLQRQLAELQVAHRLLSSDTKAERQKMEGRIGQLERSNAQLQAKSDRLYSNCELLTRQRQDIEASNKRVISNLRDRIKALTDRTGELQEQLVEARIGRELRQREFSQLMTNFETLKSQLSQPLPRPREHSIEPLLNSSAGHPRELLQEELNQVGRLKQNAFEEEIRMFDSGEDNLKRVQEIIAENAKLKEKLANLESRGGRDNRDENENLRSRLRVMKKRIDQMEIQKRQELELLVSAFQGFTKFPYE